MNTEMQVRSLATSNVVTIQKDDTLRKVEEVFQSFTFHHLLVMEKGRMVGIVSRLDVLKEYQRCINLGQLPEKSSVKVADFMTPNPMTIHASDTVGLAADIFLTNQMHALPVTDGDDIVGILTSHDVLRYAYS